MMGFSIAAIVLLSILLVCLIFQMIYYWIYLYAPYKYSKCQKEIIANSDLSPVSVIITGTNEAQNLQTLLPVLLEQNYTNYEVIFVDDDSIDDTDDVLKRFAAKYEHLYHTYIPSGSKNLSRKKLALTVGIKAAKYDKLLFIEPSACPLTADWIKLMVSNFSNKKQIVLGLSILDKAPSSYIAFDYFWTNLQMIAFALKDNPFTANGRNMGYSKSYFEEKKGFAHSNFLDLGEDDLLINHISNKTNVSVELSGESMVSFSMKNVYDWEEFKVHRTITERFYTKRFPLRLGRIEKLSRVLFNVVFLALVVYLSVNSYWLFLGGAVLFFFLRLASQLYIINKVSKLFNYKMFCFLLPIFDMVQPFVDAYFYYYGKTKTQRNYNWKFEKRHK
ncbi:glycosyltransferase involved in cell wall biosynthesis [Dysgonomonadaceae bacterium PH5-43]|nr:glycosyltransferase involved in cell wall biosynthesis [Dysgonomonadaceae bacterium PH5-43]